MEPITYDAASRITGRTLGDFSVIPGSNSYSYDALNRVTDASGYGGHVSYSYDANGNRTHGTVGSTTTTYTIAGNSNRVTKSAGGFLNLTVVNYGYNANGSRSSDNYFTYNYYASGQLYKATPNLIGLLNSKKTSTSTNRVTSWILHGRRAQLA